MLLIIFFLIVTLQWAKKDLVKARKLCNVFRFIDDLNAINDAEILENNFRDMYPEELELRRENGSYAEATFF